MLERLLSVATSILLRLTQSSDPLLSSTAQWLLAELCHTLSVALGKRERGEYFAVLFTALLLVDQPLNSACWSDLHGGWEWFKGNP